MTCPNCGAVLNCGCKKRVAKNGKPCCEKCVTALNNSLTSQQAPTTRPSSPTSPTQNNPYLKPR